MKTIKYFAIKNNLDDFYVGELLAEKDEYYVVKTISSGDYLGGIEVLRKDQVEIQSHTQELAYFQELVARNAIPTIKLQESLNTKFLSLDWKNLAELFVQWKSYIGVETLNGEYSLGLIKNVNNMSIILDDTNANLEKEILFENIKELSPTSLDNYLVEKWDEGQWKVKDENLVEIILNYYNDDRTNSSLVGKIISETDDTILLQVIDDIGVLDSITLIQKKYIEIISKKNIEFENFIFNFSKKNDYFNIHRLNVLPNLNIKNFIGSQKLNQIVSVNDYYYDNQNIGFLKQKLDNKFKLQNFDDYQLGNESEFEYEDLVSVDLASSQIKNYNLWFNEQR